MSLSSTDEKKTWKKKEIITLIRSYEYMPELWNSNSVLYKDRRKKMESIVKLTEPFNTTVEEVKRKIHNLRCQFNAELRKIKKKSAEKGIDESLVSSEWKYFDSLRFLTEIYGGTPGKASVSTMDIQDSSESEISDESSTSKTAAITSKFNNTEAFYLSNNEHNNVSNTGILTSSDYDHRIFGEYVALELRNLNERNAKMLKLKIRKAILEVAEEEFNSESVVKYDERI